jgi:hypothetical protein
MGSSSRGLGVAVLAVWILASSCVTPTDVNPRVGNVEDSHVSLNCPECVYPVTQEMQDAWDSVLIQLIGSFGPCAEMRSNMLSGAYRMAGGDLYSWQRYHDWGYGPQLITFRAESNLSSGDSWFSLKSRDEDRYWTANELTYAVAHEMSHHFLQADFTEEVYVSSFAASCGFSQ